MGGVGELGVVFFGGDLMIDRTVTFFLNIDINVFFGCLILLFGCRIYHQRFFRVGRWYYSDLARVCYSICIHTDSVQSFRQLYTIHTFVISTSCRCSYIHSHAF